MSELDAAESDGRRPSIFLSYASEDREAARLLRDALPGYGLDVWYDESDLGGGDAWDQKIRRQIRECDYFMPIVSAQTERRHEGYFRREWRFAVERTLDMADDHLFLLPIVIDDTAESGSRVPDKYLTVQWLKVPGGRPTPAFENLCRRLVSGSQPERPAARPGADRPRVSASPGPSAFAQSRALEFPVERDGEKVRFWVEVMGWMLRSSWAQFQRVPRWIRWCFYVWLVFFLLARIDSDKHAERRASEAVPSSAKIDKLKAISQDYQGTKDTKDVAKLGKAIAREFAAETDETLEDAPLLAVAFTAPAGNAAEAKFADAAFAMTYGMVAISHKGEVGLTKETLGSQDVGIAVERARANGSRFVLFGGIETVTDTQVLGVRIARVKNGEVVWYKAFPLAGADPSKIATEIDANIPALD